MTDEQNNLAAAWNQGYDAGWRDYWRNSEATTYNGRELREDEMTPNPYLVTPGETNP